MLAEFAPTARACWWICWDVPKEDAAMRRLSCSFESCAELNQINTLCFEDSIDA